MKFILKKRFFLDVAIGFLLFYGIKIWKMIFNPDERLNILFEMAFLSLIGFTFVAIPWYLVAKSSIAEGRTQLKELQGGIQYLLEQRRELEEGTDKRHQLDQKIQEAAKLYNQEINTLDELVGEFPSNILAGFLFRYRRPSYFEPDL